MSEITIEQNELVPVGANIKAAVVDNQLVLVIDVEKTIGRSSGGKMMGIASTGGFAQLSHVVQTSRGKPVSMNLYLGEK